MAAGLGCRPEEVYFLSCGTEGDNWAIAAAVEKNRRKGKHIITTAIEHAAVLEPIRELERQGYEVTWLQPDQQGIITAEQVEAALRPDTILVAMMLVNNELGTVRAIRAARCPALLHCDAVQGFLKVPFTPEGLGVDTLAVSGHKVHAPKGIGALYIRRGLRLPPLIRGGGQEEGLRSGTEPTAQTAAFAAAVEAGRASLERDLAHMRELKDYAARLPQGQAQPCVRGPEAAQTPAGRHTADQLLLRHRPGGRGRPGPGAEGGSGPAVHQFVLRGASDTEENK